ncbi:MAG: SOS response-associated peptidase family protein, partial [Pseudomonadales bacterium]
MCGRIYNIIPKTDGFETILGNWPDGGLQSYNIAPTKTVPIITQGGTIQARWGLIPSWSEEFKSKY